MVPWWKPEGVTTKQSASKVLAHAKCSGRQLLVFVLTPLSHTFTGRARTGVGAGGVVRLRVTGR